MINYVLAQVEFSCSVYGGVAWKQCVRSPHHRNTLISLDDCMEDFKKPAEERTLSCPTTNLPVNSELSLVSAGILDFVQKSSSNLIFEDGEIKDQDEFEKLTFLLDHFGGVNVVTKAFSIQNSTLQAGFQSYRDIITQKHQDSPSLFKKTTWDSTKDANQRIQFLQFLSSKSQRFRNSLKNDGSKV